MTALVSLNACERAISQNATLQFNNHGVRTA